MEDLLKNLKSFYLLASLPPLAFFALFYFAAPEEPVLEMKATYYLLIALYVIALVAIPATSIHLKRSEAKCEGKTDEEKAEIFGRAYKIRLVCLNVLSFLSGLCYFLTSQEGCYYMVGIMTIIIVLSYPSRHYIMHGANNDAE